MARAGFVIDGVTYEFPDRIRAGDWVLIREVTGLEAGEFAEKIDEEKERRETAEAEGRKLDVAEFSVDTFLGLIAAAIWQANPSWRRDRVRRIVEDIDLEGMETVDGDDALPPAPTAEELSLSSATSGESTTTPAGSEEALG